MDSSKISYFAYLKDRKLNVSISYYFLPAKVPKIPGLNPEIPVFIPMFQNYRVFYISTPSILKRVSKNMHKRVQLCLQRGGHFEHLL